MNIQILPNWCKKVGVTVFIIGLISLVIIFINSLLSAGSGINPYETGYLAGKQLYYSLHSDAVFGLVMGKIIVLLTILGMVIYLLSKEKVEDEFINKLRLEAYQLTLLLVASCLFLVFLFGGNISALFLLYLFFAVYLLVFSIKKRNV